MSDDLQLAAVRQQNIVALINKNQSAKLGELCERFGVSEATIRRDLATLETKGQLSRTHGGAVTNRPVSLDLSNENRAVSNVEEKGRIAVAAAKLITGNQTVFLDAGTTALEIARRAPEKSSCRFVTSSLGIANELRKQGINFLYVIGGTYLEVNDSFSGSIAISTIRSLSFDLAFLCVAAIDLERKQISVGSETYSQVQKEVISVSRQNYVVADHTKFRSSAFVSTATLNQLDGVITTDLVDRELLERMKVSNLDVVLG